MNFEEDDSEASSSAFQIQKHKLEVSYRKFLDYVTPHIIARWIVTYIFIAIFMIRILFTEGWYIVCYTWAIYLLNMFLQFLTPKFDRSRVLNFDFEPNGRNFLVACCLDGGVGGLKLVDLRTQATSQNLGGGGELQGGYGYMLSCAWSPANPYLCVSGNQDGLCTGWDVRTSKGALFELNNNLTISNYKNSKSKLLFHGDKPKAHNGGINSMVFNDVGSISKTTT